jgi:hypothetical protein
MAEFEELVTEARRLLAGGTAPGEVFTRVVARSLDDCLAAAVAVCVAVGIPRAEAEERLAGEERPWPIEPEDVPFLGEYLEGCGLFDIHVEYEGEQRRIADLVRRAFGEMCPVPSGLALSFIRPFETGRLHDAFVFVSRPERGYSGVDTPEYWQRLVDVAELLGPDGDAEYVDAVRRCRERVAGPEQD